MSISEGYVTEINYTYGYYQELNPIIANFVLLYRGFIPPKIVNACELGFGQGVSLGFHAAASDENWYGTDFNSEQASFVRKLTGNTNAQLQIFDEEFTAFCGREDLPSFDFIGLHGIWSWVSNENRETILSFIKRKLNLGGLVYVSYNTHPGWSQLVPLRDLLAYHMNTMSPPGYPVEDKIRQSMEFARALFETEPLLLQANPKMKQTLDQMLTQDPRYLAHEYFNQEWTPTNFGEFSKNMQKAKLSFAASAELKDVISDVNLSQEQLDIISKTKDPVLSEILRDMCTDRAFRKDYWVKGALKLSGYDRYEMLRKIEVIQILDAAKFNLNINSTRGSVQLNEKIYVPILEFIDQKKQLTLGEIVDKVAGDIDANQVFEATMVLLSAGMISVCRGSNANDASVKPTQEINKRLLEAAAYDNRVNYLLSPKTGGGIVVNRFERLFILALREGKKSESEMSSYVWEILKSQNQKLTKDKKPLETDAENLAELSAQASEFLKSRHETLRRLGVA